jgi:hypothetical protein
MALLVTAIASPLSGQCGIDVIESGVQAYRELQLETARELFSGALRINGSTSGACATENARALSYVAATYWLEQRHDSASVAFERAVIQAPSFRPDPFEFPPDITELFDRVRVATPAVAITLPEEVEIGPGAEAALYGHVGASTTHTVLITLSSPEGEELRTLYRGAVVTGARGTIVAWDGRGARDRPVETGRYELQAVSLDAEGRAVRKVVTTLMVDAPPPVAAEPLQPALDTSSLSQPARRAGGGGTWKAIAVAGAGLLGGALVVSAPIFAEGSGSWVRYPVAGGIGLAGIVGFFQRLGRPDGRSDLEGPVIVVPPPRERVEQPVPVLRVRVGPTRRVELAATVGTLRDSAREPERGG